MYNTEKCSPKLCKFSRPYYGSTTCQIGDVCVFGGIENVVLEGFECILLKKIENLNMQLSNRFVK